ncbi:MAG: hypothetical protein KKG59_02605, partial [Nanoarchaeota archaeon]|nr:hypothetical protein [Nanoarchaeota archaeon]
MNKRLVLLNLIILVLLPIVTARDLYEYRLVEKDELYGGNANAIENDQVLASGLYVTWTNPNIGYAYIRRFDSYGNINWTNTSQASQSRTNPIIQSLPETDPGSGPYALFAAQVNGMPVGNGIIGRTLEPDSSGDDYGFSDLAYWISNYEMDQIPPQIYFLSSYKRGDSWDYSRVMLCAIDSFGCQLLYNGPNSENFDGIMQATGSDATGDTALYVLASGVTTGLSVKKIDPDSGAVLLNVPSITTGRDFNYAENDTMGGIVYTYNMNRVSRIDKNGNVVWSKNPFGVCVDLVKPVTNDNGLFVFCVDSNDDIIAYEVDLVTGNYGSPIIIGSKTNDPADFYDLDKTPDNRILVAYSDDSYDIQLAKVSTSSGLVIEETLPISDNTVVSTKLKPNVVYEPTSPVGFQVIWQDDRNGAGEIFTAVPKPEDPSEPNFGEEVYCDLYTDALDKRGDYLAVAHQEGWVIYKYETPFYNVWMSGSEPAHLARLDLNEDTGNTNYALIGTETGW